MNHCGECRYWDQTTAPEGLGACQFSTFLGPDENGRDVILICADPHRSKRLDSLRLLIGDGYGCVHWKKADGPFAVRKGVLGNWHIHLTFRNGNEIYVTAFAGNRKMTAEKLCARLNQLWEIERNLHALK